ncbi:unnamed protein product [Rotaria sp. Silwood2]|nr:unnamed protein product [Rotaria sp. Silwood2]CAF2863686.1 unnamed protein product [Rotaria sp. Silwood2]CAF3279812.1 unnamed protein product [Rotaria sp. Silwood2]CAF3958102.1 unnamed protein product [Rotaria sp. Silwood2]CAF4466009.1 unnamed protein product [Rotaria sp. Silwood2]
MAHTTRNGRATCSICDKERIVYKCTGCSRDFCFDHLAEHRQTLGKEFDEIENDRDQFHQTLIEQNEVLRKPPLIQQVDEWEENSIYKIKQTADECRQLLTEHKNKHFIEIEKKLSQLTEQLKKIRRENEFNEIDLDRFKIELAKLAEELVQLPNIRIQQDSTSFLNRISVVVSSEVRQENEFNEIHLNEIQAKSLEAYNVRPNNSNSEDSKSLMNKNSIIVSSGKCGNNI